MIEEPVDWGKKRLLSLAFSCLRLRVHSNALYSRFVHARCTFFPHLTFPPLRRAIFVPRIRRDS